MTKGISLLFLGIWAFLGACSATCPDNESYYECGNMCYATCEDPNRPLYCKRPCAPGCFCNEGLFRNEAGVCVDFQQCSPSSCPEIVTRGQWGARYANIQKMNAPVGQVFIHHTAGATCNSKESCSKVARQTQNFHMNTNKWSDIGYSFLVGGDGRIYEGRGWKGVGAHTYNFNSKSIGISFMGNFDKVQPGTAMLNAARSLIDCGVQKKFITANRQIHGHRDAKCTACPGAALYKIIQTWPGFKGGKLPGYKC